MRPPAIAGAVLFPFAVVLAVAGVVAPLSGREVPVAVVVLAAFGLALGVLLAAGLATVALARREWWWGAGLLVAWPVLVPLYLVRLRRRSAEPEV